MVKIVVEQLLHTSERLRVSRLGLRDRRACRGVWASPPLPTHLPVLPMLGFRFVAQLAVGD